MPHDAGLEHALAASLDAGDARGAAEQLVRGYGGEVLGFLLAAASDDADDAFAVFAEGVFRDIGSFERRSTFRTWAYSVARHAMLAVKRSEGRRRRRFVDGGDTAAAQLAWQVRSTTSIYRRTDVKDRVRLLRARLRDDERALLVLRVDRELEWNDIAAILDEDAATLRKRFERVKEKLRALAQREGLLPS